MREWRVVGRIDLNAREAVDVDTNRRCLLLVATPDDRKATTEYDDEKDEAKGRLLQAKNASEQYARALRFIRRQ